MAYHCMLIRDLRNGMWQQTDNRSLSRRPSERRAIDASTTTDAAALTPFGSPGEARLVPVPSQPRSARCVVTDVTGSAIADDDH